MRALGLALLVVLTLAACDEGAPTQGHTDGTVQSFVVTTNSGRQIECLSWSGYQKGGLSCDWGAK